MKSLRLTRVIRWRSCPRGETAVDEPAPEPEATWRKEGQHYAEHGTIWESAFMQRMYNMGVSLQGIKLIVQAAAVEEQARTNAGLMTFLPFYVV